MSSNLSFPPDFTPEELRLKEMLEKLRKIRKAVQSARAAANPEKQEQPEKRMATKRSIENAEGATEEAKRKVALGVMTIAKVQQKQTFKRSKVLDRRLKDGDVASAKYQPYSSSMLGDFAPEEPSSTPPRSRVTSLYDNFVSSGESFDERDPDKFQRGGKTVYVRGYDLAQDPLTNAFEPFGNIVRIHIDERKKGAFIDYETSEQAEKAIQEMNGNMVGGITLRVSMARRQNNFPQRQQSDSPIKQHAWTELMSGGSSMSRRREEGRSMVTYDDADTF